MTQQMMRIKKAKDLMEDARIVEDGVTNAQNVGTTKRSRKDKKIVAKVQTSLQKQKKTTT